MIVGILLLAGHWMRYVALLPLVLFAGTFTTFIVAAFVTPAVIGFPMLTLLGQFILKDTVLASSAIALAARDAVGHEAELARPVQPSTRPRELVRQRR